MNWKQIPNIITFVRLILLIPLSFLMIKQENQSAVIIFFIAGFSDALDGFLAKRYNWVSRLGSILDPIADKALLVITMAILAFNQKISFSLFTISAVRDIYIILGAYIYYKNIGPFNMQPSLLSKLNTFLQILFITVMLVSLGYQAIPNEIILYLSYGVYFTVIVSSVHYTFVWGKKYREAKRA